jgi:hypothetical protein
MKLVPHKHKSGHVAAKLLRYIASETLFWFHKSFSGKSYRLRHEHTSVGVPTSDILYNYVHAESSLKTKAHILNGCIVIIKLLISKFMFL